MPRRPALVTQADVARTVRAAKQAGASKVEVRPDGTLIIHLQDGKLVPVAPAPAVQPRQIVL